MAGIRYRGSMVHRNKKDYRRGAVTRAALTELEDVRVINIISNPQQHKTLHERTGESVIATDHRVSDLSVQGVVSGERPKASQSN